MLFGCSTLYHSIHIVGTTGDLVGSASKVCVCDSGLGEAEGLGRGGGSGAT